MSIVQSLMSSSTRQSSKLPSGRYLRIIKGIFRCESSLIAICRASVSPSNGTSTGAFMLRDNGYGMSRQKTGKNTKRPAFWDDRDDDTHLICRALVPNTRALSYFVRYGVVTLTLFACRSPPIPAPASPPPLASPSCGTASPLAISTSCVAPLTLSKFCSPFSFAFSPSAPSWARRS